MTPTRPLVVDADPRLADILRRLALQRMVFFAGLPGTGKSLLVHQLAHVAAGAGRPIHLLQWDVARPVFEACPAGRRYPIADGVTHAVIRKAAGLWARRAVAAWDEGHPDARDLLIGETPFVGGRFVELARAVDDPAEARLRAPSCRFAIPVPSRGVRRHLEAERERRAARPLHPREREDAPPHVLRDLWRDLFQVARLLGIATAARESPAAADRAPAYDPAAYRAVYETVLAQRNVDVVELDTVLPTAELSVYDFAVAAPDLVPGADEADQFVRLVEERYPHPGVLEAEVSRWWAG